jgi:hypothetical protein
MGTRNTLKRCHGGGFGRHRDKRIAGCRRAWVPSRIEAAREALGFGFVIDIDIDGEHEHEALDDLLIVDPNA